MIPTRSTLDRTAGTRAALCLSLMLLTVLSSGCSGVNRLREAQDAFNQAATAENALRFNSTQPLTSASDAPAAWSVARNGYASALLSLEKLDSRDERSLREDGLWGATLTLKALCQWRLGQIRQALNSAAAAQQTAGDQIYPRDRAILEALPGLIKSDQAYNKILTNSTPTNRVLLIEVESLLVGPDGSVADLQGARGAVDRDHPVQVFLIQAQLATYRNYLVGLDRLAGHATVTSADAARARANSQLKELDELVRSQAGGPELVNYWARLCALDLP